MSKRKIYQVQLTENDKKELERFVAQGKKRAREINRARMLLLANEGKIDKEIAKLLGVVWQTVQRMREKFSKSKYESILEVVSDEPRMGRPIKIDSKVDANVTMIACSNPPEGRAKWTLHMIADRIVKLEVIDSISHESIRKSLKKTN